MDPKRTALAALCVAAMCGAAQAAEITIYQQPQFDGRGVTVTNAARDLAPLGITDQASSLVVRGGSWEVCTQPDFNGDCRTLAPGEYATLDASLNHRIESARQVERQARGRERDRYARDRDGFPGDGRAYESPDNGGRSYANRDRPQGGDAWRQ
jgi:hypothetical protein